MQFIPLTRVKGEMPTYSKNFNGYMIVGLLHYFH